MKALVKSKAEVGLWLEDVPEPTPGNNDVLIKVKKTSICGTDLHIYLWDDWAKQTIPVPLVVGHEFVGEIVELGADVKGFKVGDLVCGEGHIVCGACRQCMEGRKRYCPNTKGVGIQRPGAFAEYLSIPDTNVWKADPNIPLDVLSLFDPLGNAVHSVLTYPMVGEDVLVTGAGPIGIMSAAVSKFIGARHVVITDINDHRLKLAEKLGIQNCVNVDQDSLKDVQDNLGMVQGFDVALEMSGNPQALHDIIDHSANGARVVLLGIFSKDIAIDWNKVVFKMLTIKGIYGRNIFETWYMMTSLIQSGLDIEPIITHRFDYTEYEKGFEVMKTGKSGKVVLNWEQ